MRFTELGLADALLQAVVAAGYTTPTPIQAQAIPPALAGRDVFGCAQTGTGKTAAFVLPLLHRLLQISGRPPARNQRRPIRTLILTPTRELAAQIGDSIRTYGDATPLRHTVIYGGVSQHRQVAQLRHGIDILVACPGRLLDLMNQGHVDFSGLQHVVLDEADRMLDMGFIHDVRRIIAALPKRRQTLFFSATVPPAIAELSQIMLDEPVTVSVAPSATTAETISQTVYHVAGERKQELLTHLLQSGTVQRTLVFTRTKHGADRVVKKLGQQQIRAEAIHGNKSQNARTRALAAFKQGRARVLVASDIASRGIDIDDVTHVVNFDLPHEPETYVHRIGRTGRAGRDGAAISFCGRDEEQCLRSIQRLIDQQIPVVEGHPFALATPTRATGPSTRQRRAPAGKPGRRGPRHNDRNDDRRQHGLTDDGRRQRSRSQGHGSKGGGSQQRQQGRRSAPR